MRPRHPETPFGYDRKLSPTLFRHYTAVREFLGAQPYIGTDANEMNMRTCPRGNEAPTMLRALWSSCRSSAPRAKPPKRWPLPKRLQASLTL